MVITANDSSDFAPRDGIRGTLNIGVSVLLSRDLGSDEDVRFTVGAKPLNLRLLQ